MANTCTMDHRLNWASWKGAPNPAFSVAAPSPTISGMPIATAYQYHPTLHLSRLTTHARRPARPCVIGITIIAASSGPAEKKGYSTNGRLAGTSVPSTQGNHENV